LVTPGEPDDVELLEEPIQDDAVILSPGEFALAASLERISLPNHLAALLSTPSHLARFGVSSVLSSTVVHAGFGRVAPTALTLELHSLNPSPVRLLAGDPICNLSFLAVSGSLRSEASGSSYEGLDAPSGPHLSTEIARLTATGAIRTPDG
jgi:dCTP deaminase